MRPQLGHTQADTFPSMGIAPVIQLGFASAVEYARSARYCGPPPRSRTRIGSIPMPQSGHVRSVAALTSLLQPSPVRPRVEPLRPAGSTVVDRACQVREVGRVSGNAREGANADPGRVQVREPQVGAGEVSVEEACSRQIRAPQVRLLQV